MQKRPISTKLQRMVLSLRTLIRILLSAALQEHLFYYGLKYYYEMPNSRIRSHSEKFSSILVRLQDDLIRPNFTISAIISETILEILQLCQNISKHMDTNHMVSGKSFTLVLSAIIHRLKNIFFYICFLMLFKDYPYSWNHFPFHPPNEIYKDAPLCHNMFDPSNQTLQDNIVCPINIEDMPNKS